MMDIEKKDPFRERDVIKNYIKNLNVIDKNFLFYDQDKIPSQLNSLWLLCYEPLLAGKCKENIRIKENFEIKKEISSYLLTAFLLKK